MSETVVVHVGEAHDVYIGRARWGNHENGEFGNPHPVGLCRRCGTSHTRGEAVAAYKSYFWERVNSDPAFRARVQALRGKRLACFCKRPGSPERACHGDVIVAWLNAGCPLKSTTTVPAAAPTVIRAFRGPYAFLSNFVGRVEHQYQAAKTLDPVWIRRILAAPTPGEARRLGRQAPLRADWEQVRLGVMERLLREKFADPDLRARLLATGDALLQEGNWWHDRFWGVDERTGIGENHLGRLLMALRDELRSRAGPPGAETSPRHA